MRITPIQVLEIRGQRNTRTENESEKMENERIETRKTASEKPETVVMRLFPDWLDVLSYFDGESFKIAILAIAAKYNGEQPDIEKLKPKEQSIMRLILSQIGRYSNQTTTGKKSQPYTADDRRL